MFLDINTEGTNLHLHQKPTNMKCSITFKVIQYSTLTVNYGQSTGLQFTLMFQSYLYHLHKLTVEAPLGMKVG